MKRVNYLLVVFAALSFMVACKNVNYKKTKSGLLYKIFTGKGGKDSIKAGSVVKFNYTIKFNDSVMFDSHGKMPGFVRIAPQERPSYDFQEIIGMMKKGDSAVTVQMADTLMKQPNQVLPPNAKKGDRITFSFHITDVFPGDSLAKKDYDAEMEKDRPRLMKEQEEQQAKMQKQQEEQQAKELEALEKSGEVSKELKDMENWLAAKKINAQKTGKGTYVFIQQQGTGPAVAIGKYVNIKYSGRVLANDSVFQSSVYAFKLGTDPVIRGWTEGLQVFKQGGKGTLYIPGFVAWGSNPGPAGKPFAPVIFDVEVLEVSDTQIQPQPAR